MRWFFFIVLINLIVLFPSCLNLTEMIVSHPVLDVIYTVLKHLIWSGRRQLVEMICGVDGIISKTINDPNSYFVISKNNSECIEQTECGPGLNLEAPQTDV